MTLIGSQLKKVAERVVCTRIDGEGKVEKLFIINPKSEEVEKQADGEWLVRGQIWDAVHHVSDLGFKTVLE